MKQVACYMRVSTDGQSVDLQRRDLQNYFSRHDDWHVKEYVDNGQSGAKTSRPALDRMMNDVKHGRIDIVCVWKLDRLGRSLKHLISTIDELRARNVQFVSFTEAIDTTSPSGELMFHILGSIAEFERGLIRARVIAGQQAAKAHGKHIGRSSAVPAAVVGRIRDLRHHGHSWRQIVADTGVPLATVRRTYATAAGE